MKKLFWTFAASFTLALAIEVAILIGTKAVGWDNLASGRPFLAAVHVHLMAMGAIFFLVQMVLEKLFGVTSHSKYKIFYILFVAGQSVNVGMILYKGFGQIFNFEVISALTQALAALAHTATFISLFFFAYVLYNRAVKPELTPKS